METVTCGTFSIRFSSYAEVVSDASITTPLIVFAKRERALGSTTTKLFGNDYFRRYDYISMRLTIVESSATTRLSLLLSMRARVEEEDVHLKSQHLLG